MSQTLLQLEEKNPDGTYVLEVDHKDQTPHNSKVSGALGGGFLGVLGAPSTRRVFGSAVCTNKMPKVNF